jgi:hypothetical protein
MGNVIELMPLFEPRNPGSAEDARRPNWCWIACGVCSIGLFIIGAIMWIAGLF